VRPGRYEKRRPRTFWEKQILGVQIQQIHMPGPGLVYSETYLEPRALSVATITKLVRNIFMVGVIPLMAFLNARNEYVAMVRFINVPY
jgi:hypothetical protein